MKSALITGVVGQDGAYLAGHLSALGYRVVGTTPHAEPPAGFIDAYLPQVDLRVVDATDRPAMRELLAEERPDEIYNLASISSVADSWKAPLAVAEVNGLAFLGLLEAVRELRDADGYSARVCQASSAEIFGTPVALPQAESHPIRPTNPYAAAKAFAHFSALNHRAAFGMFVSTVILFNHESPLRPASFVSRKITTAAVEIAAGSRDHLELGRLDVRRDWGCAADFVRAMHASLQLDHPEDFVVATGISHELGEFVEMAFQCVGVHDPWSYVRVNPALVRPTEVPEMRGDIGKVRGLLGWSPTRPLSSLVAEMVRADGYRFERRLEHDSSLMT